MKRILLFVIIFFFILHSPLLAEEDDIKNRLAQLADDWLGFLSIIVGVDAYEIAAVDNGWLGYFDLIKDLDIIEPDEEEEERLSELLSEYIFIISDTMELAEELYDMMFADADISGAIESLLNNIEYLIHSDDIDEQEALFMYKQIAHSIWYLCDRWDIPIIEQVF